jgi:hypothetical protein
MLFVPLLTENSFHGLLSLLGGFNNLSASSKNRKVVFHSQFLYMWPWLILSGLQ